MDNQIVIRKSKFSSPAVSFFLRHKKQRTHKYRRQEGIQDIDIGSPLIRQQPYNNERAMHLTQKSSSSVLVALCVLSGSSADAFSAAVRSSSATSTTRLQSTIDRTSSGDVAAIGKVTTTLTPPSKLIPQTAAELFDTRVQKTYGRYPITFVTGSGSTLTDIEGKVYLDFVSGIATCALGHNNPSLTKAVSEQMTKIHHVSNLYYTPQQAQLANWLCENSIADKAFFCNSGAEANEAAIKLARRHASNRGITVSLFVCSFVGDWIDG